MRKCPHNGFECPHTMQNDRQILTFGNRQLLLEYALLLLAAYRAGIVQADFAYRIDIVPCYGVGNVRTLGIAGVYADRGYGAFVCAGTVSVYVHGL